MRQRLLALPLLVTLFALVAGCGGASEEDFERSVVDARNQVNSSLAHITDSPSGREELLERMDRASIEIDKAAEELDRKRAPSELRDERDQLVTAFRQLAVDLKATADQIRQPDFEDYLSGTRGISFDSWDDANAALDRLRRQGIQVQELERH